MGRSAKRGARGPEVGQRSCTSFARQGIWQPDRPGAASRAMCARSSCGHWALPRLPGIPSDHSDAFLPVVDQPPNREGRAAQHLFYVNTRDAAGALRDAQATRASRQVLLPIPVQHWEQRVAHRAPAENKAFGALQNPDSVSTADKWGASLPRGRERDVCTFGRRRFLGRLP